MKYLEKHQGSATYLVAVNGSQSAAPFILESGKAVIAMGGFGGSDPAPTLNEFKHMVATGEVHYVYVSGGTGSTAGAGGSGFGAGGGTPPAGVLTMASAKSTSAKTTESSGTRSARPTDGRGPAGSSGGSQQTSTASAVDVWVEKYGTKVSSSAYGGSSSGGTLYYVSTSAASK